MTFGEYDSDVRFPSYLYVLETNGQMEYFNEVFDQADRLPDQWGGHDFEQCTFRKLELSKSTLNSANFINCRFESCVLTQADLKNTKLYDVSFTDCKLLYVDFGACNPFGFHVDFEECQLDYALFLNRKLKKGRFTECSLREVQFLSCDLTGTIFRRCNLELARFEQNNLSQVDFSSSYNISLDPDENKLRKARFSLHNLPGLLKKYELVITE
jgi:uncharacterized protein YjbI with pentapeptide repeats